MRRKCKIGLVLGGVAAGIVAYCLWPSQEPVYEGKRLREWLDEGVRLGPDPHSTNQAVGRVVKAVQAIGTNAIPFLLQDMERKESRWTGRIKDRAYRWRLMDKTRLQDWRLCRSAWGFQALGTNAAPAVERLLALHDADGDERHMAVYALGALRQYAVPGLLQRLRSTNSVIRRRATDTLAYMGGPTAESAVPSMVAMLDDTNSFVRQSAIMALVTLHPTHKRLVPPFRKLLSDSDDQIRAYAAAGLGRVGLSAKSAIPDLVQATKDPNPTVVESAHRALDSIEAAELREALRQ